MEFLAVLLLCPFDKTSFSHSKCFCFLVRWTVPGSFCIFPAPPTWSQPFLWILCSRKWSLKCDVLIASGMSLLLNLSCQDNWSLCWCFQLKFSVSKFFLIYFKLDYFFLDWKIFVSNNIITCLLYPTKHKIISKGNTIIIQKNKNKRTTKGNLKFLCHSFAFIIYPIIGELSEHVLKSFEIIFFLCSYINII